MDFYTFMQQIANMQGWAMADSPDGSLQVEIPTMAGRTQVVNIISGADPDGRPMMFFWSVAATVNEVGDPWYLLQLNTQFAYGACAVQNNQIVIYETQLIETADMEEVARELYFVAKNADDLEMEAYGNMDMN